MSDEARKGDDEWRQRLTPEQYGVARQKDSERAFTGAYWDRHEAGVNRCMCCDADLGHAFREGGTEGA